MFTSHKHMESREKKKKCIEKKWSWCGLVRLGGRGRKERGWMGDGGWGWGE